MNKKFELSFTKELLKTLKHFDRKTRIRILRELKFLADKPFMGKQLVGRLGELKSLRVGVYRVIYQLANQTIIVLIIGNHKRVYDK